MVLYFSCTKNRIEDVVQQAEGGSLVATRGNFGHQARLSGARTPILRQFRGFCYNWSKAPRNFQDYRELDLAISPCLVMLSEMQEQYTLNELAQKCGIETRTIRSYFEKGLLIGADRPGPKATYGRYHLDRLRAIKHFRDSNPDVALDKIRLLLQSMTEENIRFVAAGGYFKLVDTDGDEAMNSVSPSISIDDESLSDGKQSERSSAVERLAARLDDLSGRRAQPGSIQSQTWHEIEITPDLKLSVKGTYNESELVKFRAIADHMRHLLMGAEELAN